jgi:hypothetical protein
MEKMRKIFESYKDSDEFVLFLDSKGIVSVQIPVKDKIVVEWER